MYYFNWQSDAQDILIHKFSGEATADFFQLVDQHIYQFDPSLSQICVVSDLTDTNLSTVSKDDAHHLAPSFIQHTRTVKEVKFALVIGSFEREEMDLFEPYAKPLSESPHLEFKVFEGLKAACQWLNIADQLDSIEQQIKDWKQALGSKGL